MAEERREDDREEFSVLTAKIDHINFKLDDLTQRALSPEEKTFVLLAIKREARKEIFREAVIQKTTISLIWSGLVGVAILLWTGLKDHIK